MQYPTVGILTKQLFNQTVQLGMEILLEFSRGAGTDLFGNDADRMSGKVAVLLGFVLISPKTHFANI